MYHKDMIQVATESTDDISVYKFNRQTQVA